MEIFLSFGWVLMAFVTFGGLTIAIQKRQPIKICMSIPLVFLAVGFFFTVPLPTLLIVLGLKPLIGKLGITQIARAFDQAFFYTSGLVVLAGLVVFIAECYKTIRKKTGKKQVEQVSKAYSLWYLVAGPVKSAPKD